MRVHIISVAALISIIGPVKACLNVVTSRSTGLFIHSETALWRDKVEKATGVIRQNSPTMLPVDAYKIGTLAGEKLGIKMLQ